VSWLHVAEEHRRQGVGTLLMSDALSVMLSKGAHKVTFRNAGGEASKSLYKKLGAKSVNDNFTIELTTDNNLKEK